MSSIGASFWICGVSWKKESSSTSHNYLIMTYKTSIILNSKSTVLDMNCSRKLKCMYLIFHASMLTRKFRQCLCSNMNVHVNMWWTLKSSLRRWVMYLYVRVFFNQLKSNIFTSASHMGHVGIPLPVSLGRVGVRPRRSGMGHPGSGHHADRLTLRIKKLLLRSSYNISPFPK